MSKELTFGDSSVPAFARAAGGGNIAAALWQGFESLSIKGKVFHRKSGEAKTLICKPGTDEPASAIEVLILDVGPSADRRINAKVWYARAFEEGAEAGKPDCYSNDGIRPEADARARQCDSCASCAKNLWGSGKDGKGRECTDFKRLAVAMPDRLHAPMLLSVPAASLKPLGEYFNWLLARGVENSYAVVTRIGFDYSVAHPALTFKAMGWAPSDPSAAAAAEVVAFITGKKALPGDAEDDEAELGASPNVAETKAAETKATEAKPAKAADALSAKAAKQAEPAAPAKTKPKASARPKASAKGRADDDGSDLPSAPRTRVRVEGEDAQASALPLAPPPQVVESDAGLDAALGDIDFDD